MLIGVRIDSELESAYLRQVERTRTVHAAGPPLVGSMNRASTLAEHADLPNSAAG